MNQELVLTSAPQGLKKGSKGFCTVISTAGMAATLAERLESMSGYRHPFKPPDPNAERNPVNYAHVTTRLAGERLHILSRVSDPGVDYSGRTNKLAHHLVVGDPTALPTGPARIFSDTTHFLTTWDGTVGTQEPPVISTPATPPSIKLSAWKQVTGDGGWAGFVAEHLLAGKTPISVIFPLGTNTLDLVREVLDLIPVPKRWAITFSTYFVKLLASTECQLRFVLDGTPEATHLRNNARAVVVDLTTNLGQAAGGALVEQARSGTLTRAPQKSSQPQAPTRRREAVSSVSNEELEGFLDSDWSDDGPETWQSGPGGKASSASGAGARSELDDLFDDSTSVQQKWILPAAVVAICLAGLIGLFFVVRKLPDTSTAVAQNEPAPNVETPVEPASEPDPEATTVPEVPEEESPPPSPAESAEPEPETPDPPVLPFDGKKPFDDLEAELLTAKDTLTWSLPSPRDRKASDPIPILVTSARDITVELISDELFSIELSTDDGTDDGTLRWEVEHEKVRVGCVSLTESAANERVHMQWKWAEGVFNQKDPTSPAATAARRFRNTTLKLSAPAAGNRTSDPEVASVKIDKDNWSPFEYVPGWPQGDIVDNLTSVFDVPGYDPGVVDQQSEPIYLLLDEEPGLRIELLPDFDLIEPQLDVVMEQDKPEATSDGQQTSFKVNLAPQDDPENAEHVGTYVVNQKSGQELAELTFEWRQQADDRLRKIWWCPMKIIVGSEELIMCPRRPTHTLPLKLEDLAQRHIWKARDQDNEVQKAISKSPWIMFRVQDEQEPRDLKKPQSIWFVLGEPLQLTANRPKPASSPLGVCEFLIERKKHGFNGSLKAYLSRVNKSLADIVPPSLTGQENGQTWWVNHNEFNRVEYEKKLEEWEKQSQYWLNVTSDDDRVSIDAIHDDEKVKDVIKDSAAAITRQINMINTLQENLQMPHSKLQNHPGFMGNETLLARMRYLKDRKGFTDAVLDGQKTRLKELRTHYIDPNVTADANRIRETLKGFDGKSLHFDVTTDLPWGEKTVRLHLVTTVAEDAIDKETADDSEVAEDGEDEK